MTNKLYAIDYVKLPRSAHLTDEGYLFIKGARIARIGVQEYLNKEGNVIRRFRPPEEVEKSAQTFEDKAITLEHPPEFPVTVFNSQQYLKGLAQDSQFSNGWIEADLKITHIEAVKAATSTHRQLSCGYTFTPDPTPGEWVDTDGVQGPPGTVYQYDEIMRNIEGNHVALVPMANAGENATWDCISIEVDGNSIGEKTMDLKKGSLLDPLTNKVLEYHAQDTNEVAELVNALRAENAKTQAQLSTIQVELDSLKKESARLEGENTGLKTKVGDLEAENSKLKSQPALDSATISDWLKTYEIIKSHVKFDGLDPFLMTAMDLKRHYLKTINPDVALDGKPNEFVEGVWCVAATVNKTTDSIKNALDNAQVQEGRKPVADINRRKQRLGKFD